MRKITADYIFPISSAPIKNGVLVLEEDGTILEVRKREEGETDVEQKEGIICPGFINTHCHIELSHLQGKLAEKRGLDQFIKDIEATRKSTDEEIQTAIVRAEEEMLRNGIVAVGDISNGSSSFAQKQKGRLAYHTFVEVFAFHPDRADKAFERALDLYNGLSGKKSIVPHAPYSASAALLKKISDFAYAENALLCMHNQESEEENLLFRSKEGKILDRLKHFGIDTSFWKPTGFNSLASTLVHLPKCNKILLVHNTVSTKEDIQWAHQYSKQIYWCFCPNANLYIENRLPDFQLFIDEQAKITIGTDSLASNTGLSVLEELKTISKNAAVPLETLLQWATLNGAQFLGLDTQLGSLEKGKKPGINLISNVDLAQLKLTGLSSVEVLATNSI